MMMVESLSNSRKKPFFLATAGFMAIEDLNASSDEEETPTWGGSVPGKAANKKRDFAGAYDTLKKQYFMGVESVYNEIDF
jgi:hypothetical protein